MIGILDVGVPFSSYLAEFGIMHDHSMKNDFSTLGNLLLFLKMASTYHDCD